MGDSFFGKFWLFLEGNNEGVSGKILTCGGGRNYEKYKGLVVDYSKKIGSSQCEKNLWGYQEKIETQSQFLSQFCDLVVNILRKFFRPLPFRNCFGGTVL